MTIHDLSTFTGSDRIARLSARIAAAKRAFTTRNVDLTRAARLARSGRVPRAGDVILARVTAIGQHRRIENIHGRRGDLYVGDEIIVAYGNRYAPDQFEAYVPDGIGPCELVAGGGVAAQVTAKHARVRQATAIEVLGVLQDSTGRTLNLADFAADQHPRSRPARVIAVVGSSMNAGKTTTVAGLVHGLSRSGFRVGAAKLTGTGSGGDLWSMRDAGAALAVDFTDAGHASTFGVATEELGRITQTLLGRLADADADIAVVEIADGLLHGETAQLLETGHAHGWFDAVLFAASDAMGAAFGCQWLAQRGLGPVAVSGLVSASPLASREAERATGIAVATLSELRDPISASRIVFSQSGRQVAA